MCRTLLEGVSTTIMAYVWNGDSISNAELQQLLGLNSIEVGEILHQMLQKQLLNKENKNRWTTYTLHKEDAKSPSDKKGDKKSDKKSDKKNEPSFTVAEKNVLILIKQDANITYENLCQQLTLGKTTLYKIVRNLKEQGIVHREGGRKEGFWVINTELDEIL